MTNWRSNDECGFCVLRECPDQKCVTLPKKNMNFSSNLGVLRLLALIEGISYLALGLTMPLKYYYEMPMPNKIVGMAHGFLFIAYCIMVFLVNQDKKWNLKINFYAYLASLIPFGTFVADAKIFKKEQEKEVTA